MRRSDVAKYLGYAFVAVLAVGGMSMVMVGASLSGRLAVPVSDHSPGWVKWLWNAKEGGASLLEWVLPSSTLTLLLIAAVVFVLGALVSKGSKFILVLMSFQYVKTFLIGLLGGFGVVLLSLIFNSGWSLWWTIPGGILGFIVFAIIEAVFDEMESIADDELKPPSREAVERSSARLSEFRRSAVGRGKNLFGRSAGSSLKWWYAVVALVVVAGGVVGYLAITHDSGFESDPVPVAGLTGVTAVSTKGNSTCAVSDGDLYCWTLGGEPTRVSGLRGVTAVSVDDQTCAIANGDITCWDDWAIEAGRFVASRTVELANSMPRVTDFGNNGRGRGTCAITGKGRAYCWNPDELPTQVRGITGVRAVDTSQADHSTDTTFCAVVYTRVKCWGDGPIVPPTGRGGAPTQIPAPSDVSDFVFAHHRGTRACVLLSEGPWYVYCGDTEAEGGILNWTGIRLGDREVSAIRSYYDWVCALSAGRLHCWEGDDAPAEVSGLDNISAFDVGYERTYAI